MDFDAIFDLARKAPLLATEEVKVACTTFTTGYHKHLRRCLAAAYASAYYLVLNEYELDRFVKLDVWKGKKFRPSTNEGRNHTLRFVLQYAFMLSPTSPNSISRYYVALESLFNKGEKPRVVRRMLMRKGPEKMYEEGKSARIPAQHAEQLNEYMKDLGEADDDKENVAGALDRAHRDANQSKKEDILLNTMRDLLDTVVKIALLHAKNNKEKVTSAEMP